MCSLRVRICIARLNRSGWSADGAQGGVASHVPMCAGARFKPSGTQLSNPAFKRRDLQHARGRVVECSKMRLRQIVLGILGLLVLVVLGGAAWSWRAAIAPISASERVNIDRQAVARGAALAAIGNCSDCHTTTSRRPYAGGRPIPTPFGTIFATNITPDAETGIGTWSEARVPARDARRRRS